MKWKPVALSPQTPQIRGTFLSNSSEAVDVLTTVDSITEQRNNRDKKNKQMKSVPSYKHFSLAQKLTTTNQQKEKQKTRKKREEI